MSEELRAALVELKSARDFYELVTADLKNPLSTAYETGAVKDAWEWLRDTALAVAKVAP